MKFSGTIPTKTGITDEHLVLDEANAKFLMYKELDVPAYWVSNYVNTIQRAKDLDISQEAYEEYIPGLRLCLPSMRMALRIWLRKCRRPR